ncbi:MAG: hypothetical protein AAB903_01100, partial [Patescibacteria group bacterium]
RAGAANFERLLKRPWEAVVVRPTDCPFETRPQQEIERTDAVGGDWRVIRNSATPYERGHRLLIPQACQNPDTIWAMGGFDRLSEALRLARY